MFIKSYASAVTGVDARTITVEVSTGGPVGMGQIGYNLVGLPDNAVKEGYQRIDAALKNAGYKFPRVKTIINLAPADIRKEGSSYDLPIALSILGANGIIESEKWSQYILMGELALDGMLRPIRGALPIAIQARKEKFKGLILPIQNAPEAGIVDQLDVIGVGSIGEAIRFMTGEIDIPPTKVDTRAQFADEANKYQVDFSDVMGQENIKRALEIAAAGGHNVILIGPPGAGKTMLARRLPTILPPLNMQEALETTKIHSVAGKLREAKGLMAVRPFRAPHHTISDTALVGGGSNPMPGEISLAHNGVLFLDELPEFKRTALEVMRQPMEERRVTISRTRVTVDFPSSFILIASMNPCPCGFYNHPEKQCLCGAGAVKKYLNRISGPLLDRIDLHVEVTPVSVDELNGYKALGESSHNIAKRVMKARDRQELRFKNYPGVYFNAQMPGKLVKEVCNLDSACQLLLTTAMKKLQLSARAYDRILKVARTAADLSDANHIQVEHLAEAIQYRDLDRENWGG
jgi:magnesium chelatase family protein